MYFFLTVFEKLYDNIMFNQDGLDKVATHINDPYCNVVLLPTHQSFLDLWILGMINLGQGLPYPFNYGEQSIVKLAIANIILQKSGTFKLSETH
jgi:hypothetical protein